MPSKLSTLSAAERAAELARNNFSAINPYDQSKIATLKNGTPIDITERTTELARNDYSASYPYDQSQI